MTWRRALAAVAVTALVAGACGDGGTGVDRDASDDRSVTWDAVRPTLRPGPDPDSANACVAGHRVCLDAVIAEMERRAAPLRDACDHNLMFAEMYLQTTRVIADELDAGRFVRPDALVNFLAWFASFYFDARDDWNAGRTDDVIPAWRLTFEAADESRVRGFGNLMAGMTAHIGDDLANAVADVYGVAGDQVDVDFAEVNEILVETSEGLVAQLAARYDPELSATTALLSVGGDAGFGVTVRGLRNEAWASGVELAEAGDRRPTLAMQLSSRIADRVEVVLTTTRYLPFVESPASRDEFCRTGS